MMTNDLIALIANLALTLSFIVALIFGIAQVKAAARDRRERLTLETLRNFQTREFAELIRFVAWREMPSTSEDLRGLPENEQLLLIQFGQQMESIGMLVAEGSIEIDLVDKTLGVFVISSWQKLKPLYFDIRKKTDDPFLSEYFQWLADHLDERMRKNPRTPFHER